MVDWVANADTICDACGIAFPAVRVRARSVVDTDITVGRLRKGTGGDWYLCRDCEDSFESGALRSRLLAIYARSGERDFAHQASRVATLFETSVFESKGVRFDAASINYRISGTDIVPGSLPKIKAKDGLTGDAHAWIAEQVVDILTFQQFWSAFRIRYGYTIPSSALIDRIASFSGNAGAVDFGAGNGYVAALCATAMDVEAIDASPPSLGYNSFYQPANDDERRFLVPWFPIKRGGLSSLRGYGDRTLLLAWPTPSDDSAIRALGEYPGSQLIVIGDERACADTSFWRSLHLSWSEEMSFELPSHYGAFDRARFYRR